MSSWTITDNIDKIFDSVSNELERAMRLVCEKLSGDAKTIIRDNKAVARGELMRNIGYEVTREAGKILGIVGAGANVPYSIFRHEGTKPHFPPIEAVQKWVVQKGLLKIKNKPASLRAMRKSKNANALEQQTRAIAFLIARKIARKGTQGLPFLRMALNQNIDFIASTFSQIKIA